MVETTAPSTIELRRKLLGGQFVPLSEASHSSRVSLCQTCPLYAHGTCGKKRLPFELDRDESILGSGLPLAKRQTRIECACPLGRWMEAGSIPGSKGRIGVFTTGFSTMNRSALLLSRKIEDRIGKPVSVIDERTPCVCLQPEIAPLYAFDLFPEAEYVAYVSPEIFFFERSEFLDLEKLDGRFLYTHRLPSPYESHYKGFFVAHRDLRVVFELAKEQISMPEDVKDPALASNASKIKPANLWWEFVCKEAARYERIRELRSPAIFFPSREKVPEREPQAISLESERPGERERLISKMYGSPVPWREVCCHFRWSDQLRKTPPYPPGTKIALDCNTAGIGDVIDVAHIVEALKHENPGVEVSVYTKNAKRSFVDLYGNYGPVEYAQVQHELPPSPWHKLDETKFARTRIENWAIFCGATAPMIAKPIISDESNAFADEFVQNLPAPSVILSPISTCPTRSWPMERYEALGLLLQKAGMSVIIIDEPEGSKTKDSPFARLYGQGAEREAAVIGRCQLLVGNDSGMAHLSCSLEIPTLVVCGPTDGHKVFAWYKQAHWMDGPLPCAGCYFYRENGWREECQHGCLSILQIGVDDVFRRCLELVKP